MFLAKQKQKSNKKTNKTRIENKIQKLNDFLIILQNAHTTVNTHTDTHTHTETDRPTDRQAQLSTHTHQCLYIFRKWNNYLYYVGAKEQKQTRKQKTQKYE